MIRKFMRATFPKIIDITFVLSFVALFIGAIAMANMMGMGFSIVTFLLTFFIGGMGIVLTFGFIYILLDIRDSLQKDQ